MMGASLLFASLAGAAPAGAHGAASLRIDAVTARSSVDADTKRALRDEVAKNVAALDLDGLVGRYTLSPSLVQLRRYVDAGASEPKLVCIVDVALRDGHDALVGSVRGSVSAEGVTQREAIAAAVHSAMKRVPQAIQIAERSQPRQAAYAER